MVLNMRLSSIAALFAAAVSLSACESGIPFMEKPIVLGCPDYFVLQEAATLTRFQDGPGRDLTDVEVRAQIGEVRLGCESDIENETDSGTLIVDVSPVIAAEMGPANKTDSATLPYFVVVTDPERKSSTANRWISMYRSRATGPSLSSSRRRPSSNCRSHLKSATTITGFTPDSN